MAKVILKQKRQLDAGYHIYRQPSEAGELITVRRKIAMPSDVQHRSSKPTQRHRRIFAAATKRWAAIPAPVRAEMSNNYGFVPIQGHFGAADYKVLKGRELFIAQEMHAQETLRQHLDLPPMLCVVATDKLDRTIGLKLMIRQRNAYTGDLMPSAYLSPGNTLFFGIPITAYPYYIGYAVPGVNPPQCVTRYYYDLIAMKHQVYYPGIRQWEKFTWSWWWRGPWSPDPLYPGADVYNWDPIWTTHPAHLWYYAVYPMKKIFGQEYWGYQAYRILVSKIDDKTHLLELQPLYLTNEFVINFPGWSRDKYIWHAWESSPGNWTIDPPQLKCVIQIYPQEIIGYL